MKYFSTLALLIAVLAVSIGGGIVSAQENVPLNVFANSDTSVYVNWKDTTNTSSPTFTVQRMRVTPDADSSLTANVGGTSVSLSWTNSTTNVPYEETLERSTDNVNWTSLLRSSHTPTPHVAGSKSWSSSDTISSAGAHVYYRSRACASGVSLTYAAVSTNEVPRYNTSAASRPTEVCSAYAYAEINAPAVATFSVASVSPENNAMGVVTGVSVSITFNDSVDALTVNSSTVTVKQGSTSVGGTPNVSGKIVTLTPSLSPNTAYTVNVSPAVKSTHSKALGSAFSSQFTTAPSVPPTSDPVVYLSATPSSITKGSSSSLEWNATNADSCTGSWDTNPVALMASTMVSPTTDTTYTFTCVKGTKSASTSTVVKVNAAPTPYTGTITANPSTVTVTQDPTTLLYSGTTNLTWSSNASDTQVIEQEKILGLFTDITPPAYSNMQSGTDKQVTFSSYGTDDAIYKLYSPTSGQTPATTSIKKQTLTSPAPTITLAFVPQYHYVNCLDPNVGLLPNDNGTTLCPWCAGGGLDFSCSREAVYPLGGGPAYFVYLSSIVGGPDGQISWFVQNADSCTASSSRNGNPATFWTGSKNPSGGAEFVDPSIDGATVGDTVAYNLTCKNASGETSDSFSYFVITKPGILHPSARPSDKSFAYSAPSLFSSIRDTVLSFYNSLFGEARPVQGATTTTYDGYFENATPASISAVSWKDTSLTASTVYLYRVKASSQSSWSSSVAVMTLARDASSTSTAPVCTRNSFCDFTNIGYVSSVGSSEVQCAHNSDCVNVGKSSGGSSEH